MSVRLLLVSACESKFVGSRIDSDKLVDALATHLGFLDPVRLRLGNSALASRSFDTHIISRVDKLDGNVTCNKNFGQLAAERNMITCESRLVGWA